MPMRQQKEVQKMLRPAYVEPAPSVDGGIGCRAASNRKLASFQRRLLRIGASWQHLLERPRIVSFSQLHYSKALIQALTNSILHGTKSAIGLISEGHTRPKAAYLKVLWTFLRQHSRTDRLAEQWEIRHEQERSVETLRYVSAKEVGGESRLSRVPERLQSPRLPHLRTVVVLERGGRLRTRPVPTSDYWEDGQEETRQEEETGRHMGCAREYRRLLGRAMGVLVIHKGNL